PDQRSSGVGTKFQRLFDDREDLPQQVLEVLGEYASASMSLAEQASYARRVVSRQEYFQNTFREATARGLIKPEQFTDEFGAAYIKIGDTATGGLANKYVHPFLHKEIMRATQLSKSMMPAWWNRVRSLITGGMLASPSVIAANFVGGLYQGATAGIGPLTMLRRMSEVLPDMLAMGRGHKSDLIEEMRR